MKTSNNTIEKTIVAFHTGRGGRFYNAGHVSFIGERKIDEFVNDLFVRFENELEIFEAIDNRPNLLEKYYECSDKEDFSFFEKLGFKIGEKIYTDGNGTPVGLTFAEAETGVGVINIDNEYDTTACMFLEDCSEDQLQLIVDSENQAGYFCDEAVIEYAKKALGIEEEIEEY